MQLSRYSIFHDGDTPIRLSLPWQSHSCQCLNTETSTCGNRGYTTETLSISYSRNLYIRLVITLYFASLIIDKDKFLLNLISSVQQQHTKSVLTSISDFFLSSEVATMWQIGDTAHKLKLRLFNKSTQLQAHLVDFHPQCEPCLIMLV